MRYFREKGQDHIQNGNAILRVGEIAKKPSPVYPKERTLRIFEVLEVKKAGKHPIAIGNHLTLSFPNDKLQAKEYVWNKNPAMFEETQIPMVIGATPKPVTKELIRSN